MASLKPSISHKFRSIALQAAAGQPYFEVLAELAQRDINGLDFSDCTMPQTWYTSKEQAFFEAIVHVEIYPSVYKIPRIPGRSLDEMQVRTLALHFEELDSREELGKLFGGECDLTVEEQQAVISEEGWILGVPLKRVRKDHE
jgi:hypothetical protein